MDYTKHLGPTPQSEALPGTTQVENSAGGYSWEVDCWTRLERFLVLGSEGGSYYATERNLTRENVAGVRECIQKDGPRAVRTIVEVSQEGRAPKNDPALLALALATAVGDADTRSLAFEALPLVARIGTHLFHFCTFRQAFGGWGRGMQKAVASWYNDRDVDSLAYQLVKYRQRDGWTHRDVLRKGHVMPASEGHDALFKWTTADPPVNPTHALVEAYVRAQTAEPAELVRLIVDHNLPREALPTEALRSREVWEALLQSMPMTAMIRNLGTMGSVGLLAPMSEAAARVENELHDVDRIRKARVHPIAVLAAATVYARGQGLKGSNTWPVVHNVLTGLDAAFYLAFGNVEPANKRLLLALDVSGSMGGGSIAGVGGITPRVGAAAMALVTAKTEPLYHAMAFERSFSEFPLQRAETLMGVVERMRGKSFGGTDCSLPMLYALEQEMPVDAFVVYTDSETWAGAVHPVEALRKYRRASGIRDAKLVVVGMVSNRFTIADPNDRGMMDVVGFDTAAPNLISRFVAS